MSGSSLIWIKNSSHMSWKYWVMMDVSRKNALGEKCPLENWHSRKIAPWEIAPHEIFLWIFPYLYFYFYESFFHKKIYFQFVYSICIIFSKTYFWFQAWYIMFIIHICVTNNAGHHYLATRGFFWAMLFFSSASASVLLNILINWASNVT